MLAINPPLAWIDTTRGKCKHIYSVIWVNKPSKMSIYLQLVPSS